MGEGEALTLLCQEPCVPGVEVGGICKRAGVDVTVISSSVYPRGGDSSVCSSPGECDATCQPSDPSGEFDPILAHHPDPHKALSAGGV